MWAETGRLPVRTCTAWGLAPSLPMVCWMLGTETRFQYFAYYGEKCISHCGGNPILDYAKFERGEFWPHEKCVTTTSLDDHCLVAGISC
jgi:hypothetical protein